MSEAPNQTVAHRSVAVKKENKMRDINETNEYLKSATSLQELADRLNEIQAESPEILGYCDVTSLPVFGGTEPRDTTNIWSWDETHYVVARGGSLATEWAIEPRPED